MNDVLYEVIDVKHCYKEKVVLQIPSFTIYEGEILAILGPSGAGKSTLLRLLSLLEAPYSGHVCLHTNGDIVSFDTISIDDRRQIATVFQNPLLLSRSIKDNIAYGLRLRGQKIDYKHIHAVLDRVSLSKLQNAYPSTLSGGEIQRVALARSIILNPHILLMDEPTANLDPFNIRLIENLLTEQHNIYGTTIILVTHDIFQAKRLAKRVALMVNGRFIEVASTDKLFNSPDDPRTSAFLSGELVG